MAKFDFGYLPRGNPCAQCGKPIAAPEWIEQGPRRISYLWHCRACDYRFEAVAFFDEIRIRIPKRSRPRASREPASASLENALKGTPAPAITLVRFHRPREGDDDRCP